MKKKIIYQSLRFFVISTMLMTFTSCDKDDNDEDLTLYGQWQVNAAEINADAAYALMFSHVVFDFTSRTSVKTLVKMRVDFADYKKGHWYTMKESNILVNETNKLSGVFYQLDEDSTYDTDDATHYSIDGKVLTLIFDDGNNGKKMLKLNATKNVKSEGKFLDIHLND